MYLLKFSRRNAPATRQIRCCSKQVTLAVIMTFGLALRVYMVKKMSFDDDSSGNLQAHRIAG